MKKLLIAAGFLLAATSASMAQDYAYGEPYGYGTYEYAPGGYAPGGLYDAAPEYGVYDFSPSYGAYGDNWYDYDRSDAPGRGNGAESQR